MSRSQTAFSLLSLLPRAASTGVLATLALAGTTHALTSPAPAQAPTPQTKADAAAVVTSNSNFAFDMLRHSVARSDRASNVLLGPSSLSTALAMALGGSEGETRDELARVLRLELPQTRVLDAFAAIRTSMAASAAKNANVKDSLTLVSANRLWADRDVNILQSYSDMLAGNFGAGIEVLNFADPSKSAETINSWIDAQTRGLIKDLLSPRDIHAGGMVLTNAVYFNGQWQAPFMDYQTKPREFTLSSGQKIEHPIMASVRSIQYAEIDGVQVARLDYIGDGSMIVLLPTVEAPKRGQAAPAAPGTGPAITEGPAEGTMQALLSKLNSAWLEAACSKLTSERVDFQLPKVDLQTKQSVKGLLEAQSMHIAISNSADFSKITGRPSLKIADVIHAVRFKVDEKKTEAAAATAVTFAPKSMAVPHRQPDPIIMHADRPYIMLITTADHQIHFIAKVEDPR